MLSYCLFEDYLRANTKTVVYWGPKNWHPQPKVKSKSKIILSKGKKPHKFFRVQE